jgi:hypothetical protein
MARDMNKASGDIVADLGLTEDQMEALEESGVSTTITLGDAFRGFGTTVKEVLQEAFGPQIEAAQAAFNQFLDELTANTAREMKSILGFFIGGYEAIAATWRMLPSAIGDAAVGAANAAVTAIEWMLNRARDGINALIPAINGMRGFLPGGSFIPEMSEIGEINLGEVSNPYEGALSSLIGTAEDAYAVGQSRADSLVDGFGERWEANSRASAERRIREAAGEPDEGRDGSGRQPGMSAADREALRLRSEAERFLAGLQQRTAEIGLNEIERQLLAVAAAAEKVAEVDAELAQQIRDSGEAWRERHEAFQLQQQITAVRDMTSALGEEAEVLALERDLIGATNQERARQIAMLRAEIDLRRQAEDFFRTTGIRQELVNTPDGQRFIEQAGQNAIDAAALADMRSLHDALASTFESAFRQAMTGDWRGVLETVLMAVLDRTLASLANDFANLFSQQQGGGSGLGSIISAGMSLFGGGAGAGTPKMGGAPLGGSGQIPIKITFEATEGKAFGARILEVASPAMVQVGTAAAQGGAALAIRQASRASRNRLGVG